MRIAKVQAFWNLHSDHEIASQEDIDQVDFDMRDIYRSRRPIRALIGRIRIVNR
jgi:hypothetical protein